MNSVAIIFSGWNHRAIIAFCRFCRKKKVPFIIVAKDNNDPILLTDYRQDVGMVRTDSELSLCLLKSVHDMAIEKKFDHLILMPTTEYLNRFFLENRADIEGMGYIIPLCDSNLYNTISDKEEFEKMCRSNSIMTPGEYSEISRKNLPFVIKPRNYFFGGGVNVAEKPKLIMSEDDYDNLSSIDLDIYYCQEFIGGEAFYLLYYFAKDGTYSVYSQKNLSQQHSGLSIVAAESANYHKDSRAEAYTQMFLKCGFQGLVMVEVRDYKGEFYMIEANPRFWGPSQLILDSEMDLFEKFAYDCGLIDVVGDNHYHVGKKYFWLGGYYETTAKNKKCVFLSGYNASLLVENFSKWLDADIYKRNDTISVFEREIGYNE